MTGQTVILHGPASRANAHRLVDLAPAGAVANIRPPTRTTDQNSLLWALLSDVSRAKPQGRVLKPEGWKCLFMDALGKQATWEPSLDGNGVVNTGFRSSRLTKAEMSDMIELIYAYAAQHGVALADERKAA